MHEMHYNFFQDHALIYMLIIIALYVAGFVCVMMFFAPKKVAILFNQEEPTPRWASALLTVAALYSASLFLTLASTPPAPTVTYPDAPAAYKVVNIEDASIPGRDRFNLTITAPDARARKALIATAMNAALNFHNETEADVVGIWLDYRHKSKSERLVALDFFADRCGNSGTDCDGRHWSGLVIDGPQPAPGTPIPPLGFILRPIDFGFTQN